MCADCCDLETYDNFVTYSIEINRILEYPRSEAVCSVRINKGERDDNPGKGSALIKPIWCNGGRKFETDLFQTRSHEATLEPRSIASRTA